MRRGLGAAVLALLLAGPALSLPSILVLSSILGWKKTLTFTLLVVLPLYLFRQFQLKKSEEV